MRTETSAAVVLRPLRRGLFARGRRPANEHSFTSRLAGLEGNGYRILRHVEAGRDRIDQLIVGPTGVFVVHVNTWSGKFFLRRDGWFSHTRGDAGELVWEVAREAMAVKAHLRSIGIVTQVQGVVAVARSKMAEPIIQMGRVTFVEGPRVVDYLRSRRTQLTADQVNRAASGIPA
jgi:Nuclease-related domain